MTIVIQMGLDRADDKLWYIDEYIWDDDTIDTVHRPTEILAFRHLFRQSRMIRKRGLILQLSPLQREVMRWEYQAMRTVPMPDNIHNWISARMYGLPPLQVKALLDECSYVVLLRDILDMQPLDLDWESPAVTRRAA